MIGTVLCASVALDDGSYTEQFSQLPQRPGKIHGAMRGLIQDEFQVVLAGKDRKPFQSILGRPRQAKKFSPGKGFAAALVEGEVELVDMLLEPGIVVIGIAQVEGQRDQFAGIGLAARAGAPKVAAFGALRLNSPGHRGSQYSNRSKVVNQARMTAKTQPRQRIDNSHADGAG